MAIPSPSPGWANPKDCVEFTCTGLYNVVMRFEDARTEWPLMPRSFYLISSDNDEPGSTSSAAIPGCQPEEAWNAYLCGATTPVGVLMFDSLDADRMDRSVQPVWIQANTGGEGCAPDDDECFNNKLNSYMDHCWDGAYTCQKRESRFPTMVYQKVNQKIDFTGTPPQKMQFVLHAKSASPGFQVTIKYPNAGAYQLYDAKRQPIQPTDWDHAAGTWAAPAGTRCGQWRYEGVINRLQFWIQPGCTLYVHPRDAVMLGIRMEFTLDEFFASGGVTTFADRMAAVLGIHAADIKVVSVFAGSTIVEFAVLSDPDGEEPLDLGSVQSTFETAMEAVDTFMGSLVLNAVSEGVPITTPHTPPPSDDDKPDDFFSG